MNPDSTCQFAIETDGLTKRFKNTTAVRDLSLRIPRGSAFGFIGPNGAGKTTTIKMLMGMLPTTSGEARVLGADVFAEPVEIKQRVGYVPEMHFIHRWMRVREAVAFCRSLYWTWNDRLCADYLRLFELDPEKKIRHLSKGMVAKLALLLAIAHEPEVLILDEPMAGLDPVAREEFLDGVLRTVTDHERTILFSSHTLSDVQRLADTIGIIHEGQLLVHCGVDALLASTKRIRAVLKDGQAPKTAPENTIWQRVQEREWLVTVTDFSTDTVRRVREANPVDHVEVLDISLEEIFKDYVRGWRASA